MKGLHLLHDLLHTVRLALGTREQLLQLGKGHPVHHISSIGIDVDIRVDIWIDVGCGGTGRGGGSARLLIGGGRLRHGEQVSVKVGRNAFDRFSLPRTSRI
jgi:hypothetical protein